MREIITATPQDLVETAPASWAREQIASGVYAGFENSQVPCGGIGRKASFFPVPGFVRECITVEVDEPETFGSFVRELITVEEDEPETFGSWSREEITTGVYAGFNNVAGGAAGRHAGFNDV